MKICILAAGTGSRNTHYKGLHKALLPVENKPAISHIIGNTPNDMEIVIAVGYLKDQIKSYLDYVHPNRKITYVTVDPYEGPETGPGKSLLACKRYLQCPFILTSADTLIPSKIEHMTPSYNWIGVDKEAPITYACLLDGKLERIEIPPIYIGIAGIYNWDQYFLRLESSASTEVTDGFDMPIPVPFNWIDTGSDASYKLLQHSVIVPAKNNQAIFLDNGKVIKFFCDPDVAHRVWQVAKRNGFNVTKINDHMVAYPFIKGKLFSDLTERAEFYTNAVMSKIYTKGVTKPEEFSDLCSEMYEQKTRDRVKKLLAKNPILDSVEYVNGIRVKPIDFYLNNIPWTYINESSVASTKFHGDVQPENIIVGDDIYFIDWRDGFAGNTELGDMYYDLGKLWHDCLISNQKVLEKKYNVSVEENSVQISIEMKPFLIDALKFMEIYSVAHNLDWKKIELLGALQYITIACLYDDPKYETFLFLLGKLALEKLEEGTQAIMELIKTGETD